MSNNSKKLVEEALEHISSLSHEELENLFIECGLLNKIKKDSELKCPNCSSFVFKCSYSPEIIEIEFDARKNTEKDIEVLFNKVDILDESVRINITCKNCGHILLSNPSEKGFLNTFKDFFYS